MDVKKEEIIIIGRNACFIALICGILFILVLFAAMFAYPGGYDFWGYYISSLGAVHAENGSNNIVSRILFFGAMSIGAYSLLFFWVISYHLLEELKCQESNFVLVKKLPCQQIITFGSIMGLIATPFMILIAVIPTDDLPSLHELVTIIFFICLCIALIPVSGTYVMTAAEAIEAAKTLNPKLAIPMHFGTIVGDRAMAEKFERGVTCKVEIPSIE